MADADHTASPHRIAWADWLQGIDARLLQPFIDAGFSRDTALLCIMLGRIENSVDEMVEMMRPDNEGWR